MRRPGSGRTAFSFLTTAGPVRLERRVQRPPFARRFDPQGAPHPLRHEDDCIQLL